MSYSSPNTCGDIPGGAEFPQMIEALRRFQDSVSVSRPPRDVIVEIAGRLSGMAAMLAPYAVPEDQRITGRRWDLKGRGQCFVPPISIEYSDPDRRIGKVAFSPFHLGSGGVVNGGVIPLVFTEMLGLFAISSGRPFGRMAYLNVTFKAPVLVGAEVGIDASLLRIEGRKVFVGGRLFDETTTLASAEALFVAARTSNETR